MQLETGEKGKGMGCVKGMLVTPTYRVRHSFCPRALPVFTTSNLLSVVTDPSYATLSIVVYV